MILLFLRLATKQQQRYTKNCVKKGTDMTRSKAVFLLGAAGAVACLALSNHLRSKHHQAIVNDVRCLLDTCKSIKTPEAITIEGKCLVWDMTSDSRSPAHNRLPEDLKLGLSAKQATVFMIVGQRTVQVGTYSVSHQPGYREYIDVCVAYWPEKTPVGMHSVVSKEPAERRPVQHAPEYGDPHEPIARWISGLPQRGSLPSLPLPR